MEYYDHYARIKALKPVPMRERVRSLALDGLSIVSKLKGIDHLLLKPRVQFLYIHHVFKDEEDKLDRLLHRLSTGHRFISYSEAVDRILEGRIDRPYISISSDDGFKNNVQAAGIMDRHGAKACFFINPSIIGERSFDTVREHCRTRLSFPPVEFMDWDEVARLQHMGHEVGSHTMDHINVANTPKELFQEDCQNTMRVLTDKCGEVRHFAFPYGRFFHFNEDGRRAVFNTGFTSCATAERGCHIAHDRSLTYDELCIHRDHVILDWDLDHILYFLAKNVDTATTANNVFPYASE